MDYVEAASILGGAIVESDEFKAWRSAEIDALQDEKAQSLMDDYKETQTRMVQASRDDLSKEKLSEIRETLVSKQKSLEEYDITRNYLEAKKGFEGMMKTINDVLAHFVNGGEEGCGGDCGSCSGCH